MIYNVTRTDRNIDRAVDLLVGKQFGLLYKLKNRGIGSEPFIIQDCSSDFEIDLESNSYDRKCNIELRPKGIILHFRKKSSTFIWVIDYASLHLQQSESLTLLSNATSHMQLIPKVKPKKASPFIKKLSETIAASLAKS